MSKYDIVNDAAYRIFCDVVKENPDKPISQVFSLFAKELALSVFDVCVDRYREEHKK